MRLLIVGAALALSGVAAQAQTPAKEYQGTANFGMTMCRLTFDRSQINADSQSLGRRLGADDLREGDYSACVAKQKEEARQAYAAALAATKTPEAKAALKEHLIAVLNYLEGINPGPSEVRSQYLRRQVENESRVKDMWTRFEVEQ